MAIKASFLPGARALMCGDELDNTILKAAMRPGAF